MGMTFWPSGKATLILAESDSSSKDIGLVVIRIVEVTPSNIESTDVGKRSCVLAPKNVSLVKGVDVWADGRMPVKLSVISCGTAASDVTPLKFSGCLAWDVVAMPSKTSGVMLSGKACEP